ncbi:ionotropic receptor 21a-like [Cherax quadricarinatus]|uniref:ionotropic receptor 21a-like n=1 Tax=Cherax quadricarinatus TaxID=27406 RepID=UPI00387E360A
MAAEMVTATLIKNFNASERYTWLKLRNVPFEVDETDLRQVFSKYGVVHVAQQGKWVGVYADHGNIYRTAPHMQDLWAVRLWRRNLADESIPRSFEQLWAPWGVGVFKVVADSSDANMTTQTKLSLVVAEARRLRQVSWCVTVVVVSDNADFLNTFAECSLKVRLLVWSTRLLAVTRLQVYQLLSKHWTFSMMNAMLVVLNETLSLPSFRVYVNLPYSVPGARIVGTAVWKKDSGLQKLHHSLFPEKFNNFYGATVNVTALPYRPYWSEAEERSGDNTGVTRYSGSDAMMLRTIADALNFTFNVLPVSTWDQVTGLVMERSSLIASIFHIVLPQRQLLYDFTYIYLLDSTCFSVATPSLTSKWESLFSPLADEVWVSVLVILLLVPPCLFLISRSEKGGISKNKLTIGDSAEVVLVALLGQGTKKQLPESSSSRLLLVTWLAFAFIVSNVYRGNLTAALTLPKYPPRPETLEQLVKVVDKVTMPDYGEKFHQFFKQSDSVVYQTLSNIMEIVPSAEYGLRQAAEHKQAYMDGFNYLQQMIADYYTMVDGTTKLYIGRENIIPGPGAWPIPHDAPYKPQLDKLIMYIIEAGLYEKWIKDMILRAKAESRRRQHKEQVTGLVVAAQSEPDTSGNQALTLLHMQGPLMIVAMGLSSSIIVFIAELLLKLCMKETSY